MILYGWQIIGSTFQRVYVLDAAKSIIWINRFQAAGTFEIYTRANTELLTLLGSRETYWTREGKDDNVMVTETVRLTTSAEDGAYIIISGNGAESFLARRIIPKQTVWQGKTAEYIIRDMINANIGGNASVTRKVPRIVLGDWLHDTTRTIDKQVTGKNLLEAISDICAEWEYGFKMVQSNGTFTFQLYKGTDRSYNQSTNDYVVFSPEWDNLGDTEYTRDKTTLYNAVYVAGEGEGSNRVIAELGGESGLQRRELWVDARNESSTTEGGTLTPMMYYLMLRQQASETIDNNTETVSFEGEVLDTSSYIYGVDYNLGDIVQVETEYGIQAAARVTGITEVEDESGYQLRPTLEDWSVN
ncbi:MAG: siphovirus ReqiPepy6 Gp37-like family protein [Ruminococcus sp.]|nr:siphovirus ReqiPepy6 Gp37-like family protein [Ruminococcus sp.]